MNVKINKYFLILLILVLFFGFLSFYNGSDKHVKNLYFNRIEETFNSFEEIEEIFKSELDNYLKSNYINKYSIKEIRDGYTNIKLNVLRIVNELKMADYYKDFNKKYLLDILEDVLSVVDNNFLSNEIFKSEDETIIRNLQNIVDNFNRILNKYNIFKINFGIMDI